MLPLFSLITKITLLLTSISPCLSFFSPTYRKCKLNIQVSLPLSSLPIQIPPSYTPSFTFPPRPTTTLQVVPSLINFIYDEYIDAGGSGEVYRVEDAETGQVRVIKRFFKQNKIEFEQENYIMNMMRYPMLWHRQDNDEQKSMMASYPYTESVVLRDLQVESEAIPVLFYKICKQLEKSHRQGIIHNDMKMGNILIHSVGEALRTLKVQLIDWNLASFYFSGYESSSKKGTNCYYSPESLLRTSFITPGIDIWSLAVVFFNYVTQRKPFPLNCKQSNLQAIIALKGASEINKMIKKYNKISGVQMQLLKLIKQDQKLFNGISLRDRIPQQMSKIIDSQMIDLFQKMLQVDPQYRLNIEEVLMHPYFQRVKQLPKMYVQKSKKAKQNENENGNNQKKIPANNLVVPQGMQQF